jgi:[protein-PII] uridylyltransferase
VGLRGPGGEGDGAGGARGPRMGEEPGRRGPGGEKIPRRLSEAWERLCEDRTLQGREWSRAAAALADRWLAELFWRAAGAASGPDGTKGRVRSRGWWRGKAPAAGEGPSMGLALMAVGSLGRVDLAPGSDLDLVLVHAGRPDVNELASRLWYPIWDDPMPLDHSVRTIAQAVDAAESDLKVALGLLDARFVAGDAELGARFIETGRRLWQKRSAKWVPQILQARAAAQEMHGEVAFLLEPNLQESLGGLRDVQILDVLRKVTPVFPPGTRDNQLLEAAGLLHAVKVELQRPGRRHSEKLLLEDLDRIAEALGMGGREDLAREVASAGRSVAWLFEDTARRARSWLAGPRGRAGSADKPLGRGLVLRDDEVAVPAGTPPNPALALHAAAASAELGAPLARQTMNWLAEQTPAPPAPWPAEVLDALLKLLATGRAGVHAIETLDHLGIWERYLPEWPHTRNRPQFDPYHRWTVDRHLLETVAGAAARWRYVSRPDLLLLGALFHDIGKGMGGDHSIAGAEVVAATSQRIGLPAADAEVVTKLVRHHLLLPDAATRRDIEDPSTAEVVAATAGDLTTLELLASLAAADGEATGPSAWTEWKARLIEHLTAKASALLEGKPVPQGTPFPTEAHRQLLAAGGLQVLPDGHHLVVVAPDRPGLLSDVTGALALHGLAVREARAYSEGASALEVFELDLDPLSSPRWERVAADIEAAVQKRSNFVEALARRDPRALSRRPRRSAALPPTEVHVSIDNRASAQATVVEVRAPDQPGLLHHVTAAMAALGLDIVSARVTTLGATAVDSFYVRAGGGKVADAGTAATRLRWEIERRLEALTGGQSPNTPEARNTPET